MKQTTRTRQLDNDKTTLRVLTANDLRKVVGGIVGATAVEQKAETEVLNNPLYQGSGETGVNPLHQV